MELIEGGLTEEEREVIQEKAGTARLKVEKEKAARIMQGQKEKGAEWSALLNEKAKVIASLAEASQQEKKNAEVGRSVATEASAAVSAAQKQEKDNEAALSAVAAKVEAAGVTDMAERVALRERLEEVQGRLKIQKGKEAERLKIQKGKEAERLKVQKEKEEKEKAGAAAEAAAKEKQAASKKVQEYRAERSALLTKKAKVNDEVTKVSRQKKDNAMAATNVVTEAEASVTTALQKKKAAAAVSERAKVKAAKVSSSADEAAKRNKEQERKIELVEHEEEKRRRRREEEQAKKEAEEAKAEEEREAAAAATATQESFVVTFNEPGTLGLTFRLNKATRRMEIFGIKHGTQAEKHRELRPGLVLEMVAGEDVSRQTAAQVMSKVAAGGRPLMLGFSAKVEEAQAEEEAKARAKAEEEAKARAKAEEEAKARAKAEEEKAEAEKARAEAEEEKVEAEKARAEAEKARAEEEKAKEEEAKAKKAERKAEREAKKKEKAREEEREIAKWRDQGREAAKAKDPWAHHAESPVEKWSSEQVLKWIKSLDFPRVVHFDIQQAIRTWGRSGEELLELYEKGLRGDEAFFAKYAKRTRSTILGALDVLSLQQGEVKERADTYIEEMTPLLEELKKLRYNIEKGKTRKKIIEAELDERKHEFLVHHYDAKKEIRKNGMGEKGELDEIRVYITEKYSGGVGSINERRGQNGKLDKAVRPPAANDELPNEYLVKFKDGNKLSLSLTDWDQEWWDVRSEGEANLHEEFYKADTDLTKWMRELEENEDKRTRQRMSNWIGERGLANWVRKLGETEGEEGIVTELTEKINELNDRFLQIPSDDDASHRDLKNTLNAKREELNRAEKDPERDYAWLELFYRYHKVGRQRASEREFVNVKSWGEGDWRIKFDEILMEWKGKAATAGDGADYRDMLYGDIKRKYGIDPRDLAERWVFPDKREEDGRRSLQKMDGGVQKRWRIKTAKKRIR
ncbi:MAG: hypothetical protein MK240_06525 [Opitutales bacterium]|nr:hypothetical protein [Opitutales bacterium]